MHWRLILKEFVPELKRIKGEHNVVSNALSRLEISENQEILNISELYGYDDADLSDSINSPVPTTVRHISSFYRICPKPQSRPRRLPVV